ncbi:helix-turn-helix transcriptional regulator [Halopiger goleimassiliensis]|uniref:helix-turn-helix transcriptional regulator n=1 Tax=Halopiger goleimassiliensis TaxID=1293048 RepID=UPI0006778676|nr:helix-turn-helix domain-containing protein [Halopiger goleimassiliensis]
MTLVEPEDGLETDENVSRGAIESVAFLARSEHRVRVLSLLDGGARTRDEISDAVGATRVTLSRILGDLEDRGLIARRPSENAYELTRYGELVHRDFSRLLGTVSIGQECPDVVERLPADWLGFDLRYLADAELVSDDGADLMSAARVVANAIQHSSSRNALLGTFLSVPLYTFEEALREGKAPDGAVVFDPDVAETILTDPDLRERWRTIESIADSPVYYRTDERVPCAVSVLDDEEVFLTVEGERNGDFDVIRCTHPEVVDWVDGVVEAHLETATPLRQYVDEQRDRTVAERDPT